MPPLPPILNTIKVEIIGSDSGGFPWANIIHFSYTGGLPTVSDMDSFASDVVNAWETHISPQQASNLLLTDVITTDLSSASGAQGAASASVAGTLTGSFLAASTAFLISYPGITPRYRGGHPRQYLNVGVQASLLDEAHWTDAFVTNVSTAWADFINAIQGATHGVITLGPQCAVSYYTTDYTVTPPKRVRRVTPEQITLNTSIGNAQLASQRRRIGRNRR